MPWAVSTACACHLCYLWYRCSKNVGCDVILVGKSGRNRYCWTRSWILQHNKRSRPMSTTLVQELTFEDGAEYCAMFRMDECEFWMQTQPVNTVLCPHYLCSQAVLEKSIAQQCCFSAGPVNTGHVQAPPVHITCVHGPCSSVDKIFTAREHG